jgi:hypothetical protein
MTIDKYLAELRRHLNVNPLAKRRILREIAAHLADAAERDGDEHRAVLSLGSPAELATRFARTGRITSLRWLLIGSGAAVAGAVAMVGWQGGARPHLGSVVPALALLTRDDSESDLPSSSSVDYTSSATGCTTISTTSITTSSTVTFCPSLIPK